MVPWKLIQMLLWMLISWLPIKLWTEIIIPIWPNVRDKVVEKGVEKLLALVVDASSVEEKLDNVKRRAARIKAMLEDAEQRRYIVREDVLNRLSELRGVAFDFDDLVEEFEAKKEEGAEHKIKWLWYCMQISGEIDNVQNICEGITSDKEKFILSEAEAPRLKLTPEELLLPAPSGSQQDASEQVYGRESKILEVVELLCSTSTSVRGGIPVISIEGLGGIGKTTFARSVIANRRIKEAFQTSIWIDLSQGFDATRTIKEIIKCLTNGEECPSLSLDLLHQRLKALLCERLFLLVLDSVWNQDHLYFWDTLHAPLSAGKSGSKVLMTTRDRSVSRSMHASHKIVLDTLDNESLWRVLRDQAFVQGKQDHVNDFASVGRAIAAKCDGSPLAAKLLGRILCGKMEVEYWQGVLDEMPDPEAVTTQILSALKLSYDKLPLHLKHCFAYCSIFPKGYEFDKDEIVHFWMAEGLIKTRRARENVQTEDTGRKHFDELLQRSFFQPVSSSQDLKQKYQMPSLIHDLAQYVSKFECLSLNHLVPHDERIDARNARYALLSYRTKYLENLKLICMQKSLRTVILHNQHTLSAEEHDLAVTKVPSSLLNLKRLRVLDMSYSQLEELPDSIGDLIHLRYLGLRGTWLTTLPRTVKGLCKLQNLELGECNKLKELPKEICSLTKLRHLGLHLDWENWVRSADNLTSMPPGIGKLTSLLTLSRFSVASDENCRINQLGNLINLRGELCITNLENVVDGEEAAKANLSEKPKISSLMLRWSSKSSKGSAYDVASGLRPYTNLKSLMIENYVGAEFPGWMEDRTFTNLETLRLYNSESCKSLPCVAKLPKLKNLHIKGFHEVKSIPALDPIEKGFASLEVLHLSDMSNLEALFVTQDGNPRLPISLRKLELRDCPKLIIHPSTRAPKLCELVVGRVHWAIIGWFPQLTYLQSLTIFEVHGLKHVLGRCVRGFNNLQTLKIESCMDLKSFASGQDVPNLSSLKHVEIRSCPELEFLPSLPVLPLGCRIRVMINQCPKLNQFCQ